MTSATAFHIPLPLPQPFADEPNLLGDGGLIRLLLAACCMVLALRVVRRAVEFR